MSDGKTHQNSARPLRRRTGLCLSELARRSQSYQWSLQGVFTPWGLAADFTIDAVSSGAEVIDLCAGIGILSYFLHHRARYAYDCPDLTCVELNPRYVEIGRRLLPEAAGFAPMYSTGGKSLKANALTLPSPTRPLSPSNALAMARSVQILRHALPSTG